MNHGNESQISTVNDREMLIVDLNGFEGPLDLLLDLARQQKVDLRQISILMLAEQYADFIEKATSLEINLAAEYLIMAAWLALIKSRLLLPEEKFEESPEDLSARLTFRLQRLNAMREAVQTMTKRPQLGYDFFARGHEESVSVREVTRVSLNVLDLTQAYARARTRDELRPYSLERDQIFTVEAATANLKRLLGETTDWQELSRFLPKAWTSSRHKYRSAISSTLVAALELAKQGRLGLRQSQPFSPIQVMARTESDERF